MSSSSVTLVTLELSTDRFVVALHAKPHLTVSIHNMYCVCDKVGFHMDELY